MAKKKSKSDGPRIYVAALAAYNNGKLHGEWIDANQDPAEIREEIQEMLKTSPERNEEEWAIHDYEGFGKIKIGEFEDIDKVSKIAEMIEKHGKVFAGVYSYLGDLDDAIEAMEERYLGQFKSLEDWAYQWAEDTGDIKSIPKQYENYIDWEAIGRDADLNGDIFTVEGEHYDEIHVFSSN